MSRTKEAADANLESKGRAYTGRSCEWPLFIAGFNVEEDRECAIAGVVHGPFKVTT